MRAMSIERDIEEDLAAFVELVEDEAGIRARRRRPRVIVDPDLRRCDAEADLVDGVVRVRPRTLEDERELRRTLIHEAAHVVLPGIPEDEAERIARRLAREIESGDLVWNG